MKPLSLQIPEEEYEELESAAKQTGQTIMELVQQVMVDYLKRRRAGQASILDIPAHQSGRLLSSWSRADLLDEMLDR